MTQSEKTFCTESEVVGMQIPLALLRASKISADDKLVFVLARAQEKLGHAVAADEIAANYCLDQILVKECLNNLYENGYLAIGRY